MAATATSSAAAKQDASSLMASKFGAVSSLSKMLPIRRPSSAQFDRLLAGITGGVASTVILHPLDVVKTRFAGELSKNFSVDF